MTYSRLCSLPLYRPFDLSFSLGVKFGSPEHEAAIKTIREAAHKYGKKAAFFCEFYYCLVIHHNTISHKIKSATSGTGARKRVEEGFDLVTVIPDIDALANALVGHVKDALGGQLESSEKVSSGYASSS